MMRALGAALVVVALALTAGCGDDEDTSATTAVLDADSTPAEVSPTPAPATPLPRCDGIWIAGSTLPDDYQGCRADGQRVAKSLRCETGQQLYTFEGRFFGVPGGPVFRAEAALADDLQFQKMTRVCRA